jgi:serine/threonine protein kinase
MQQQSFLLGHYLVTPEKLGSGGTSEVFLGYDLEHSKPVAVKKLTPPVDSNGARNRDWDREVRALSILRGESNCLRLLDVFTANSNAHGGVSAANSLLHPGHHHHGAHHAHRNSHNQDVTMSGTSASSSASFVYQIYDVVDGKDLLELFNSNPSA